MIDSCVRRRRRGGCRGRSRRDRFLLFSFRILFRSLSDGFDCFCRFDWSLASPSLTNMIRILRNDMKITTTTKKKERHRFLKKILPQTKKTFSPQSVLCFVSYTSSISTLHLQNPTSVLYLLPSFSLPFNLRNSSATS